MILASLLLYINLNLQQQQDVSVQILSKNLRLMREAGCGSLDITMPVSHLVRDGTESGIIPVGKLRIMYRNRHYCIVDPSGQDITCSELKLLPVETAGECTIDIEGTKRRYPLPLIICAGNPDPVIAIREDISRYSLDSALAEYGTRSKSEQEAVFALAHIIRARTIEALKKPAHGKDHFCDLTHCQVYRGRTAATVPDDGWDILPGKNTPPFLFHACCGGETLGSSVFTIGAKGRGVRDVIISTGDRLCGGNQKWTRSIKLSELLLCFDLPVDDRTVIKRTAEGILFNSTETKLLPFETFRLTVNRKRGWSFLRSNTYSLKIRQGADGKVVEINGNGLGHGVGFCQEGALELARRGYSRYEMLCHYFPDLKRKCHSDNIRPELSWCTFDLSSGMITDGNEFILNRSLPPGSFSKLVTALYLARKRPDLLQNYRCNCAGDTQDSSGINVCWERKGHGELDLASALKYSCNRYFYSLYNAIDYKDYTGFINEELSKHDGVNLKFPAPPDVDAASRRLAGLDFTVNWQVKDIIAFGCYLSRYPSAEKINTVNSTVLLPGKVIMNALHGTFSEGTASGREKHSVYMELLPRDDQDLDIDAASGIYWGKTSTVLHGTNDPVSYGMFMGGNETEGIITILRGGSGHCAARWALHVLKTRASSKVVR